MPIERKLAAIMFTDIAGYTEQMSKSKSKTFDTLEKKRLNPQTSIKRIQSHISKRDRRWNALLL